MSARDAANDIYLNEVMPILADYCFDCHDEDMMKGDVDLTSFPNAASVREAGALWKQVYRNVKNHVMPPAKKAQPSEQQRDIVVAWLDSQLFPCDPDNPDPGRVTLRRLNRVEYNNTIRDLVGVDFNPAEDFPADDSGYGFDNIGDVLTVSPLLLEKYLMAAERILDAAIITDPEPIRGRRVFPGKNLQAQGPSRVLANRYRVVTGQGVAVLPFKVKEPGSHRIEASVVTRRIGPNDARMEIRLDGEVARTVRVTGSPDAPQQVDLESALEPGAHRVSFHLLNPFEGGKDSKGRPRERGFAIETVTVLGPPRTPVLPDTHVRIFAPGQGIKDPEQRARAVIGDFARRAWRRPLRPGELDRLIKLYELGHEHGERFEKSVKLALEGVLVSAEFLFRSELQPEPDNPRSVQPVNEFALASRLSYFLWSSMPDKELFALAEKNQLRSHLEQQVRRMLRDPKASALVTDFAGQWLQTRSMALMTPDSRRFPTFDDKLREAMRLETETYFAHIAKEDRSLLELLDSDYTFLNERLARHYGIPGVEGDAFRKVKLNDPNRGGVLTQASVLTLTSNPTRTSPVKRGKWVLENLLGTPPPPPPPNVPKLDEPEDGKVLTGTLRERLEQHRADPGCAGCHARMDPIGFGLENFDAIGVWRETDAGDPIDPSGELVTGEKFSGPAELRRILLESKRELFLRCAAEKMLTYSLGRGLEDYDRCTLDKIVKQLEQGDARFSELVLAVVRSAPFQRQRGDHAVPRTAQVSESPGGTTP